MNDYVARGGLVLYADASQWRSSLAEARKEAQDFVNQTTSNLNRLVTDGSLARWDSMLNQVVRSIDKAVAAGRQIPTSTQSTLTGLHNMFVDLRAQPGAYARAEVTSGLREFVAANSIPGTSNPLAYSNPEGDSAIAELRQASKNAAANAEESDKLFNLIAQTRRQILAEEQQYLNELRNRRSNAANQNMQAGGRGLFGVMPRSDQYDVEGMNQELGARRLTNSTQNMQAGGRSLFDVMAPQMSDWMRPHYGSFSPIDPDNNPMARWRRIRASLYDSDRGSWNEGGMSFDDEMAPIDFTRDTGRFRGRGRGGRGRGQLSESTLRNINFASQQVGYGIDDAIQSYQYGGVSASVRAASNNLTAILGTVLAPQYAIPAVVGASILTAGISLASSNGGDVDTLPTTKFSGKTSDPMSIYNRTTFSERLYKNVFEGGFSYQERFNEEQREDVRSRYEQNTLTYASNAASVSRLYRNGTSDQGRSQYREAREKLEFMQAKGRSTAEGLAATDFRDQQKVEALQKSLTIQREEAILQQMYVNNLARQLPYLERRAELIRKADFQFNRASQLTDMDRSEGKFATAADFMAAVLANNSEQRDRVSKLSIPKEQKEDMLRQLDENMERFRGTKDVLDRQWQEHLRVGVRAQQDYMHSNDTTADRQDFQWKRRFDDVLRDAALAAQPGVLNDILKKASTDRADLLYSQRQSWRPRPIGWTQLDQNREDYGKRLEEIEKSKTLTPEERRRQLSAAKKSFEESNVVANKPEGQRKYAVDDAITVDSREDVSLKAFMMRGGIKQTKDAMQADANNILIEVKNQIIELNRNVQNLGVKRKA